MKPNRLHFFCRFVYNICCGTNEVIKILQLKFIRFKPNKNPLNFIHFPFRHKTGLIILLIIIVLFAGYNWIHSARTVSNDPVIIVVEPGMSTQTISNVLYEKQLIQSSLIFRAVAKLKGLDNSLKAGEYIFTRNMSIKTIVDMLGRGALAYKEFTIPEGYTINQIAELLEHKKLASANSFRKAAVEFSPHKYMEASYPVTYKAEGFVFPDTYRINAGTSEKEILTMMVKQFDAKFTPEMQQKAKDQGLSVRQVIILASLVEKEARAAEERPIIAGVFLNRLKAGMPLQSCATIQYILGYAKPELTIQDTEIPSDYNTYIHTGLPPGPIANPGTASISAVLSPAATDYLYFVADKQGMHHHFSKTYEEHLAAIEQENNE
ncbi:MAG: putative aminodeoxychorismate lyase [Firmicutes bacterium]|nr:putative aminodeoxychorismate lyase [Bacillota bacterium]